MSELTDFVLARFDEEVREATPATVVISGGSPSPEIPNCIGPSGKGDCPERWSLDSRPEPGWWKAGDVQRQIYLHSMSHASPQQIRRLAEIKAKHEVLSAPFLTRTQRTLIAMTLAHPYDDHPDFHPRWLEVR